MVKVTFIDINGEFKVEENCLTVEEGIDVLATRLCLPIGVIDHESNCHLAMLNSLNYNPFFLAHKVHDKLGIKCDQYLPGAIIYEKTDLPEFLINMALTLGSIKCPPLFGVFRKATPNFQ